MKTKEEKERPSWFILDEDSDPWEIGAGLMRLVGGAALSYEERVSGADFILSGASGISEEEALRIAARRNRRLRPAKETHNRKIR
jgi:hypothetical protein